jgi:hypothetical protein
MGFPKGTSNSLDCLNFGQGQNSTPMWMPVYRASESVSENFIATELTLVMIISSRCQLS